MKVYERLSAHLRGLKRLPILISPYIKGVKQFAGEALSLDQHVREWDQAFARLQGHVDIVAFQDGNVSFQDLPRYLAANRELAALRRRYETELLESVVPFWTRHSPDRENGGFFNCLDRDGQIYDTTKHVWLQGRQAWMLARLYRAVDPRPEWRDLALSGVRFLRERCLLPGGRLPFTVTADGRAVYVQRKIFSECFYVMALAELSRATGDAQYSREAEEEFERIWDWAFDWTKVGRPAYPGETPKQSFAVPMILLNLIEELTDGAAGNATRPRSTSASASSGCTCRRRSGSRSRPWRRTGHRSTRPRGGAAQPGPRDRGRLVLAALGATSEHARALARSDRHRALVVPEGLGHRARRHLLLPRRGRLLADAARVEHEALVAARRGTLRAPARLLDHARRPPTGRRSRGPTPGPSRTSRTRGTASGTATSTGGAR